MSVLRTRRQTTSRAMLGVARIMLLAPLGCGSVDGQDSQQGDVPNTSSGQLSQAAQPPADPARGCGTPVSQRPSETGCYLTAETPLGVLPDRPLFWHLHAYSSRAAAEAARGERGTVVEAFDSIWLYTIAEESWRPGAGHRIAAIGPLSTVTGKPYTARYMEAVFPPGYILGGAGSPAPGHTHSGPEAWYVLTGAQCLETPDGLIKASAGEGALVPQGPPMAIYGVGPETRRAVLLVLHPSDEPWMSRLSESEPWKPTGLCLQ
jgi:hypothetical protein